MFTTQLSDRRVFAAKAKRLSTPVTVVRMVSLVPVPDGSTVIMRPAVTIDYAIEFDDADTGETKWTYREVILADEDGEVNVRSGNLLDMLTQAPAAKVRIVRRSGSF